MGKQRRERNRHPPWTVPNWNGDDVDWYYAEEFRADGIGSMRERTIAKAERAWAVYESPWETEDDLRTINDALAPYWLPYVYRDVPHGATLRELAGVVGHDAPARILDVGCGVGFDACFLAASFPSVTVTGSDLAPVMVARAQARAQRRNLTNARFIVSAHRDLPSQIPEERFDFAYSHGSLLYRNARHLFDHLHGIRAVLQPGGILLCEMPMEVDPNCFVSDVVHGTGLGFSLHTERGEIRTLAIGDRDVCWCCEFRLDAPSCAER